MKLKFKSSAQKPTITTIIIELPRSGKNSRTNERRGRTKQKKRGVKRALLSIPSRDPSRSWMLCVPNYYHALLLLLIELPIVQGHIT